eukprot:4003143-Karenia_brevis.AAC.1
MAALIGGARIHTWGCTPANATDAANKTHTKKEEVDVDTLFLNAMGMRWIVIDEISTVSPTLLGLLEAHLGRACRRHPYAKFKSKTRVFGGNNI